MDTIRHRELNKIIAGVLAITLVLISSLANSIACAPDLHPAESSVTAETSAAAENSTTVAKHTHHANTDTSHADRQKPSADSGAPVADNSTLATDCCDSDCQCVSACSAVLAIVGPLQESSFELLQMHFDPLSSGETQLLQTIPFRPPINA
jgi:hypothetical protein